jgi:hypothetical protein
MASVVTVAELADMVRAHLAPPPPPPRPASPVARPNSPVTDRIDALRVVASDDPDFVIYRYDFNPDVERSVDDDITTPVVGARQRSLERSIVLGVDVGRNVDDLCPTVSGDHVRHAFAQTTPATIKYLLWSDASVDRAAFLPGLAVVTRDDDARSAFLDLICNKGRAGGGRVLLAAIVADLRARYPALARLRLQASDTDLVPYYLSNGFVLDGGKRTRSRTVAAGTPPSTLRGVKTHVRYAADDVTDRVAARADEVLVVAVATITYPSQGSTATPRDMANRLRDLKDLLDDVDTGPGQATQAAYVQAAVDAAADRIEAFRAALGLAWATVVVETVAVSRHLNDGVLGNEVAMTRKLRR